MNRLMRRYVAAILGTGIYVMLTPSITITLLVLGVKWWSWPDEARIATGIIGGIITLISLFAIQPMWDRSSILYNWIREPEPKKDEREEPRQGKSMFS